MASKNDVPELLRPKEIAAILGIRQNAVYELIKRGELPAAKVGKMLFVPKDALMQMLEV